MIIDVILIIDSRGQNPYIDRAAIICRSSNCTEALIKAQASQWTILHVLTRLNGTSLASKNPVRLLNGCNDKKRRRKKAWDIS